MTLTEFSEVAPIQPPEWFILAKLEHLTLVFPSALVAETFLIERSQILTLPFYDPAVLGCIHHSGKIVPLLAVYQFFQIKAGSTRESLTVIRLNGKAGDSAGIGLAVDTIVGRELREQLPPQLFVQPLAGNMRLFQPEILRGVHRATRQPHAHLGVQLWQPQRWHA